MKIEKIHLHNFRQFSGDTIVEFSTEKDKNITVIHAMNGSGKTTFLQSFYWGLYGQLKLPNANRLLNENIFASMDNGTSEEVFVEVVATHENSIYTIKRSLQVTKDSTGNMKNSKIALNLNYTDKSGRSKELNDEIRAQDKINHIIPEKLARYFFFDGERIESLGDNTAKARKDIANGIKSILNIDVYDELKNILEKKVLVSFQKDMRLNDKDKSGELADEKNNLLIERDTIYSKKIELENTNINLDKRIDELNKIIMQDEAAMEYEKQLQDNKSDISKLEKEIENMVYSKKGSKKEDLPKVYTQFAIFKLLEKLQNSVELNLEVANVTDNAISGINAEAIDQILDNKVCICGREIGSDEKIKLENLRQYLPPHDQRMLIYGYKQKYLERINSLKDIESKKDDLLEKYFSSKENISELQEINKNLSKKINTFNDVKEFNLERNIKAKERDNNNKEIGKIDSRLSEIDKNLEKIDKDIETNAKLDDYNNKILKRIHFINDIVYILEANINKKKKQVHSKLTDEVNYIFSNVSHKNTKEVIIDDDYSYKIRDKVTKHEALSEGEAIITSLSFIASIIKIAKDLEEQKKDEVGEGVEYPLVLDAPFAKLDSVHIKGIAPVLPKFADQVILLTVDQQFRGVTENNILNSIGREYDMKNIMDKEVIIERIK